MYRLLSPVRTDWKPLEAEYSARSLARSANYTDTPFEKRQVGGRGGKNRAKGDARAIPAGLTDCAEEKIRRAGKKKGAVSPRAGPRDSFTSGRNYIARQIGSDDMRIK